MVGMGGATTLLMATTTTAWEAATHLTAGRLAWSGAEVASEEVTAATGEAPSTPSTQHSQWPSVAMKIKVGFGFTSRNLSCSTPALQITVFSLHPACTYTTHHAIYLRRQTVNDYWEWPSSYGELSMFWFLGDYSLKPLFFLGHNTVRMRLSFFLFLFVSDAGGWNTAKDAYGSFGNNRGKSAFFNDRGNANRGR